MEEKQYRKYIEIAKKITNGDERYSDLTHDVLIQLQFNAKFTGLSQTEQTYFFARAARNQFNSNNSQFQRTYRRFTYEQFDTDEQIDTEYVETPSIEWMNEVLTQEELDYPDRWYDVGLFRMYMEFRKIDPIHKKTRIPKYSIRKTINEMKLWIKTKWEETQNGNN